MQWLLLIIIIPYIYYILKINRSLHRVRPFKPGTGSLPFLSVIVACRNEEKNLPEILGSLARQDFPGDHFEVIIIDDNSTDGTYLIASSFQGIKNLKVLMNNAKGKKAAIRLGVTLAAGDHIVTTDADCMMGREWLRSISSFFDEKRPDMIICPVALAGGDVFFQKFQELEFLSLQGITAGTAISGDPVMCNGANLAFSKKTYLENQANIHDEIPSGDDVFLLHAVKGNHTSKIMWMESSEALVITKTAPDLETFFRQRARWISKAGAYNDKFTRVLGIVTFVTILLEISLLTIGVFSPEYILIFLAGFILKSIPDFLILKNTTRRYNQAELMRWFLPSQLVYPYYIMMVVIIQSFRSLSEKSSR
jgi:poly-beta-1,6-N-acetyl-D-glucosamine synthase